MTASNLVVLAGLPVDAVIPVAGIHSVLDADILVADHQAALDFLLADGQGLVRRDPVIVAASADVEVVQAPGLRDGTPARLGFVPAIAE